MRFIKTNLLSHNPHKKVMESCKNNTTNGQEKSCPFFIHAITLAI